jgi:hypothetical protein
LGSATSPAEPGEIANIFQPGKRKWSDEIYHLALRRFGPGIGLGSTEASDAFGNASSCRAELCSAAAVSCVHSLSLGAGPSRWFVEPKS